MWKWKKIQAMSWKIKFNTSNSLIMQKDTSGFYTEELSETSETFREFIKFLRDLVIIIIIVILIRIFLITPFRINGSSMEESYHDREYILVDKFSYLNFPETYGKIIGTTWVEKTIRTLGNNIPLEIWNPVRGDVVVITPHVDKNREYYIKRVIAVPWDTIRIKDGKVYIKKPESDKFIEIKESYLSLGNAGHTYLPEYVEWDQFLIPDGSYWVMWDNRNNSSDSRTCFRNCFDRDTNAHFIKRQDIVWKVFLNFGYFNLLSQGWLFDSGKLTWTYPPRLLSHPRSAAYPELWE